MIREIFIENMSLWVCVWQSTLFAAIGLAGSFLLGHRPARAFQVLFLTMIAAVLLSAMSVLIKHFELGMFTKKPIAVTQLASNNAITSYYETSAAAPSFEARQEVQGGEMTLTKANSGEIKITWRMIVLYGWIAAASVLSVRLFFAFIRGIFLLRRAQPNGCEQILQAADSARERFGITKELQVLSSKDVNSPVIWCWSMNPILLIPDSADYKIDWVGVICHELAHFRRKDYISGLTAELVVCILPWNLLLWWSKKRMMKFSEQACDDWVLASGQPCEDYAQTLLNFSPQRQAAFVPAVVSSRKTLAGRVRRILEDSCDNPRAGVVWALTASLVMLFLAVGIAFAQKRPLKPTGTIKTKASSLAVIEQPAFDTMMIKGQILYSNNEPAYLADIIALPVTSYGARVNKEGYFELPWSPTWLDKGQSICLIAKSGHYTPRGGIRRNEAAIVEITDPTQPITIRLEPVLRALEGKVVDPNGQNIPKYWATLSPTTEFKCRAPIFETEVWEPRMRIFSPIPYGTKYRLTIKAVGYQTKQIIVDAMDRNKEIVDIGSITLQPQNPARSAVTKQERNPDLAKEFHDIYRLDAKEVFKLIKPPFVLGRQEYLHTVGYAPGTGIMPLGLQHGGGWQTGFHWDGELKAHSGYTGRELPWVLRYILDISEYDFDIPKGLNITLPRGDWIVRADSPKEEQLRALEEIIYAETDRVIRFEKRKIEREVVVARGRFEFKPPPTEPDSLYVNLTWDGTLGNPVRSVKTLTELFNYLEWRIKIKFVDETEPSEYGAICYRESQNLGRIPHEPELKSERLSALLENLALTTSLQFTVEKRPAEIWFVTEKK